MDTKTLSEFPDFKDMNLEDIVRRKEELRSKRFSATQDLRVLMEEQELLAKAEYRNGLSIFEKLEADFKEIFGFGQEHAYKQKLKDMGRLYVQYEMAVKNILVVKDEFGKNSINYKEQLTDDTILFGCNKILYENLQQQKNEKQALLDEQKKSSVRPLATTEAFELQKELMTIQRDLDTITQENNDLGANILTRKEEVGKQEETYNRLLTLFVTMDNQRSALKQHYDAAMAEQKMVENLKGVSSVDSLYALGGVMVQEHDQMKKDLHRRDITDLDPRFKIGAESAKQAKSAIPYWLTIEHQILG